MAAITWDDTGKHYYETGVDHGVLFVYDSIAKAYKPGIAWNGLKSITEAPSGAEATAQYADNIKYLNLISAEEFKATLEAFQYPPEFGVCDGTAEPAPGVTIGQQDRATFALAYRTKVGSDADANLGYKLHVVYGCTAAPSQKAYTTVSDSPEAMSFSWEISTTPVAVTGYKPTSIVTIDSRTTDPTKLSQLETILYGGASGESKLPLPDEIITIVGAIVGAIGG